MNVYDKCKGALEILCRYSVEINYCTKNIGKKLVFPR